MSMSVSRQTLDATSANEQMSNKQPVSKITRRTLIVITNQKHYEYSNHILVQQHIRPQKPPPPPSHPKHYRINHYIEPTRKYKAMQHSKQPNNVTATVAISKPFQYPSNPDLNTVEVSHDIVFLCHHIPIAFPIDMHLGHQGDGENAFPFLPLRPAVPPLTHPFQVRNKATLTRSNRGHPPVPASNSW